MAARKVRKKIEDNIRSNQSLEIVSEVLAELRRSRESSRASRCRRIVELIVVRVQKIALQAPPLAPSKLVNIYAEEEGVKGLEPDRVGTRAAQVRRPTKVTKSWNSTYVKISFVNSTRHKAACREERACLLEKGRVYEEIKRRLLVERRVVLPPKELMVVPRGTTGREEHSKATKERP